MNSKLLQQLKRESKKLLESNTRFHDYGHALEVLENVRLITKKEGGDEDILYASALFHDASNFQKKGIEGKDGAKITKKILEKIPEFPKEKIADVCRLIISIDGEATKKDEQIIDDADSLAVFSKLSIARGFMIYGKKEEKVEPAIKDFIKLIDRKYKSFMYNQSHTRTGKKLAKERYKFIKEFLEELLNNYEDTK